MSVVDTNVLIYDTFEDSEFHEEAKELLDSTLEWEIPTVVIIELVAVMNKLGIERSKIISKLKEILNHPKTCLVKIEKRYHKRNTNTRKGRIDHKKIER